MVCNSNGRFTQAYTDYSNASTAYEAKAATSYQALQWAYQHAMRHTLFKGDTVNVILALNGSYLQVFGMARWQGTFV